MGSYMRDAWVRYEEHHTAWLNELEFVEIARALKKLAVAQGVETDAVINELVHFGVDAAFALLAVESESKTGHARNRQGAGWETKPAGVPLVH